MLDQTALSAYFGHDVSMLRRFIVLFVQEAPALVNQMDEAALAGDWDGLAIAAHTLKSQLRYFGFPEQVEQLEILEKMAEHRQDLNLLPQVWQRFNADFGKAYEVVSALQ